MDNSNVNNANQPLTKRQRREMRRQENAEQQQQATRRKIIRKWIIMAAVILAVAGVGYLTYRSSKVTPGPDRSANNPYLGGADAKVVVTEFSDLSCPACAAVAPIVDQLAAAYGDKIKIVFNNFNIGHRWSEKVSEAGECAFVQGKFWEFGKLAFSTQADWEAASDAVDKFKAYAEQVGLDKAAFSTCLDSGSMKSEVAADTAYGQSKRVNATPTFFVNDQKLVGAQSFDDFKKIIDPLLATAGVNSSMENTNTTAATINTNSTNQ